MPLHQSVVASRERYMHRKVLAVFIILPLKFVPKTALKIKCRFWFLPLLPEHQSFSCKLPLVPWVPWLVQCLFDVVPALILRIQKQSDLTSTCPYSNVPSWSKCIHWFPIPMSLQQECQCTKRPYFETSLYWRSATSQDLPDISAQVWALLPHLLYTLASFPNSPSFTKFWKNVQCCL